MYGGRAAALVMLNNGTGYFSNASVVVPSSLAFGGAVFTVADLVRCRVVLVCYCCATVHFIGSCALTWSLAT